MLKTISSSVLLTLLMSPSAFAKDASDNSAIMGHVYDKSVVEQMLKDEGFLPKAGLSADGMTVDDYIKAAHKQYEDSEDDDLYEASQRRGKKNLQIMANQGDDGATRTRNYVMPMIKNKARVLAILVDFPDYPKNSILPEDTGMYYADYNTAHFESLIFGENGYEGPNQQNLISMRQYYEQQSGGTYSVEGNAIGWYRASQPAAFYGKRVGGGADINPRQLIRDALIAADNDPNVDLGWYDQEDRYDIDGDGNLNEPDGIVDHIMIFHSSVGEEAGGGALGTNAIWSHRWNLGNIMVLPNSPATVNYWGGSMAAYDYTIEPIDAAAGVVSHEYGHDLGLPDEYDYTPSLGDAVSYWSIMSAGSWAGAIPGTEPVGFSPWAKEFLQASLGGQWFNGETISLDDIGKKGLKFDLNPAVTKGQYNDFVRVNIPDKEVKPTEPFAGDFSYYSSQGNNLNTTASTTVDLTGATSASMTFKLWYDIEADWDYGRVLVNGNPIRGSVTTGTDPNGVGFVHGFTGNSNGWVDAQFDLSAFTGQQIQVSLNYLTDGFVSNPGFFADNMSIVVDGVAVASFDAEADNAALALTGFSRNNGVIASTGRYYLVEFRQYIGVDKGLQNLRRAGQPWSFDPGVVIWYVDQQFSDNSVGVRPGEGWLSVVDNDQNTLFYSNGSPARSSYQLKDAALSEVMQSPLNIEWTNATLTDDYLQNVEAFSDRKDYSSPEQPHAGRILPTFGLRIVLDDVEDCDDLNDDIDFNDDDDDACHATVKIKKK